MKNIIIIISVITLLGCNSSTVKDQPNNKETQGMPSNPWLDLMRPALAASICDDKNLLRSCFKVNKAKCDKSSLAVVSACIDLLKPEIPSHISREQASHIAGTLGVCSAKSYAFVNQNEFLNKPDCEKFSIEKIQQNK